MFVLDTQKNYAGNAYAGYSDIGNPAFLDYQIIAAPFTKTLGASGNIEYADGKLLTYRGVDFAGYLYPFPELNGNSQNYITGSDAASRFITHTFNTGTHTCKIRTNILLNSRIFQNVKLANYLLFELLTTFTGNNSGMTISGSTITIVLKKVNSAGSITTLKTISNAAITGPSGTTTRYDKNLIMDTAAIATLSSDDVFYLDTEINYTAITNNGGGTFGIANNQKNLCRMSYDL